MIIKRRIKVYLLYFLVIIVAIKCNPCPVSQQSQNILSGISSIITARIQIEEGSNGLIQLVDNKDVQCYSYTLKSPFNSVPNVAVAISDLQARKQSKNLFLVIKPLKFNSLTSIPFLIRTDWKHTSWKKIVFSFMAEDKLELQAAYFQIDSSNLGSCDSNKKLQAFLPYKKLEHYDPKAQLNHKLFLSGFQISRQGQLSDRKSPFQLKIIDSKSNREGITVIFLVFSITQVHAIHISYLAWFSSVGSIENIISGYYQYDDKRYQLFNQLFHHSPNNVGRNYARIYGISGFSIKSQNQIFDFTTQWSGNKFIFQFGEIKSYSIEHFKFEYLFFTGSECSGCTGYPYSYNGQCLKYCPIGTTTADNSCIVCRQGFYWSGQSCIKSCPEGQLFDHTVNDCVCPINLVWTGTQCIQCNKGRTFNNYTKTCQCSIYQKWNGYTCIQFTSCPNGKEWNIFKFECQCSDQNLWNGTYCIKRNICRNGQSLNSNNQCVCPKGMHFKDNFCKDTGCYGGQQWNGTICACQRQYNWNGTVCLLCINGQEWNYLAKQCLCSSGTVWNGNFCEKFLSCSGGRIFNEKSGKCLCPNGMFWYGVACMIEPKCCCGKSWNSYTYECQCPDKFYYDGHNCVSCINGKQWKIQTKTCQCSQGSQWNGQFCAITQVCQGGMIWNQNTWACECPSTTVWNGNYCIFNPCQGGLIWDNSLKNCICSVGKINVNSSCLPVQKACTYGRIWNPSKYICQCLSSRFDNGISCEDIPSCKQNQIYNPHNNKCQCPTGLIWLELRNSCGDPTCPTNERWNGYGCVKIQCPPNTFYKGGQCISQWKKDLCQEWEIFNGEKCVYFLNTCPIGTKWDNKQCISVNMCPPGFYGEKNFCKPFPQKCISPTTWNGNQCVFSGTCPYGAYQSGNSCKPHTSCQNGQVWNEKLLQCTCPKGTGWSGNKCVQCGRGQIWDINEGCVCPQGHFFIGANCEKPTQARCQNIPHASWSYPKNICICNPGFNVAGYQCTCRGVPFDDYCDRCAHKPNSEWKHNQCQCKQRFNIYGNQCLPDLNYGSDQSTDCSIGTYFDFQRKRCLKCSDGCLTCFNSFTCQICDIHFRMDAESSQCIQNCGDGKRFILGCDDGNNIDGDGCTKDCRIQSGYTCRGGSPTTSDNCIFYHPQSITIIQTGQIRYSTKLSINIKLDYLPISLIQSQQCNNSCNKILKTISSIPQNKITSKYIPGTSYSFTIEIQFNRNIANSNFSLEILIDPSLKQKYFNDVNIDNKFIVDVDTRLLAIANEQYIG